MFCLEAWFDLVIGVLSKMSVTQLHHPKGMPPQAAVVRVTTASTRVSGVAAPSATVAPPPSASSPASGPHIHSVIPPPWWALLPRPKPSHPLFFLKHTHTLGMLSHRVHCMQHCIHRVAHRMHQVRRIVPKYAIFTNFHSTPPFVVNFHSFLAGFLQKATFDLFWAFFWPF